MLNEFHQSEIASTLAHDRGQETAELYASAVFDLLWCRIGQREFRMIAEACELEPVEIDAALSRLLPSRDILSRLDYAHPIYINVEHVE